MSRSYVSSFSVVRACSVAIFWARAWSSQKPGSLMADSSSARRSIRRAGSKVITDPGKLGPDLIELLGERYDLFGHRRRSYPCLGAVAALVLLARPAPAGIVAADRLLL